MRFCNFIFNIIKSILISASKLSNRTPVVNISAKFQIRIQVAAPSESSSDCSSSQHSSSGRLSNKTAEPDTPIDKVANRVSEMCILSVASSENGSVNDQESGSVESDRRSVQSDNNEDDRSKESVKSGNIRSVELAKVDDRNSPQSVTPKSKPRKLQLDKLKTPRAQPVAQNDALKSPKDPQSPVKILSEADQRLLNELYGTSWQTPDLLKKCKLLKKAPKNDTKVNVAKHAPVVSKPKPNQNDESIAKEAHDFSKTIQDFSMCKFYIL